MVIVLCPKCRHRTLLSIDPYSSAKGWRCDYCRAEFPTIASLHEARRGR